MTRKTYMLLVNYLRKSRLFILPITLATALSGCALTQNNPQDQSNADSNPPPLQEQVVTSKETEIPDDGLDTQEGPSSQSLETAQGITKTGTLTTPVIKQQEQPVLPPQNIWDRLLQNFQLDLEINNPRIQAQLNWYKRHPKYLERMFARAERYLYHVVEQVETKKLPGELALLPIVESAYDPFAYSHGRASGMWQFIPSTARYFGIKNNWWYDGRRDVLDSTDTALSYLDKLNRRFKGNWNHALAAYNAGGGNVNKAIRKNREAGKPTDFWSLRLPKETKAYVPKLIALAKLVKQADHYGIKLADIPNEPYFKAVDTKAQIDLAQAAKMAEITINELYLLNPGFSQWATSPDGPHRLLVPSDKADIFAKNLAKLPPSQRLSWQRYKIKSGDSLISISKKFNTTTQMIRSANQIKGNSIRAGGKLLIPIPKASASHYALSSGQRLQRKQNYDRSSKGANKIEYKVKSGDSFWSLARKHRVGMRELAKWNGMAPTDPLHPGKKLVIWSKKASKTSVASNEKRKIIRKVGYKVRRGDSLARIAGKFNVSVKEIVRWNKISKKKYLQPGQSLTLYVDVTRTH